MKAAALFILSVGLALRFDGTYSVADPARSSSFYFNDREWTANVGAAVSFDLEGLFNSLQRGHFTPTRILQQIQDEVIVRPYGVKVISAFRARWDREKFSIFGSPRHGTDFGNTLVYGDNQQSQREFSLKFGEIFVPRILIAPSHALCQGRLYGSLDGINSRFQVSQMTAHAFEDELPCVETSSRIDELAAESNGNAMGFNQLASSRCNYGVRATIGSYIHGLRRADSNNHRAAQKAGKKPDDCQPKYMRQRYDLELSGHVTPKGVVTDISTADIDVSCEGTDWLHLLGKHRTN